jgi:hypothetical protein
MNKLEKRSDPESILVAELPVLLPVQLATIRLTVRVELEETGMESVWTKCKTDIVKFARRG